MPSGRKIARTPVICGVTLRLEKVGSYVVALFPEECLTPAYYLRAVGDVIEHALWNWNPLPFPAPAMMKPKIKGRFASSGIIDGEKRQMNVLTVDYRVPININIRTKTEFHEQNAKK
jgi:hypothetical protein